MKGGEKEEEERESGPPVSITDSTIHRSHFDYDNAKNTSRWKFKCNFQSGWPAIFHWGFCFSFLFSLDPLSVKIEFSIWRQYLLFSPGSWDSPDNFQAFKPWVLIKRRTGQSIRCRRLLMNSSCFCCCCSGVFLHCSKRTPVAATSWLIAPTKPHTGLATHPPHTWGKSERQPVPSRMADRDDCCGQLTVSLVGLHGRLPVVQEVPVSVACLFALYCHVVQDIGWFLLLPPPLISPARWPGCGYWHSHRAETAPSPSAVSCLIVAYTGSRLISLRWHVTALTPPLTLPHLHLSRTPCLYRRICP